MKVHVFGNPDLPFDSLPLRILPRLRELLPDAEFLVKDPNEEWDVPETFIMVDTVMGIGEPRTFASLADFSPAARVSVHDFDVYANLRLLEKIGRLRRLVIVGLPSGMDEAGAAKAAADMIRDALREKGR